MLEKTVESYLVREVKRVGGLCPKFVSPGLRGVPDRMILIDGKVFFVETKQPQGNLRIQQHFRIKQFREKGMVVYTAYTFRDVDEIISSISTSNNDL